MKRRSFLVRAGLVVASASVALPACTLTPAKSENKATKRHEIDAGVDAALSKLYTTVHGARELAAKSRGILVFPEAMSAGFVVGGEYGEGALRIGGRSTGYYRTVTGSVGFQAGAQSKAIVLMFMTQQALDKFVASQGWTAGVDATVALAKIGANGVLDTTTAPQSVVGFVLTNAGLMAGVNIEGAKISKLEL